MRSKEAQPISGSLREGVRLVAVQIIRVLSQDDRPVSAPCQRKKSIWFSFFSARASRSGSIGHCSCTPGGLGEPAWIGARYNDTAPIAERRKRLTEGVLYKYCDDVDIYRCPTGIRAEVLTYAIVDAMNGAQQNDGSPRIPGTAGLTIKRLNQVQRQGERFVFIDEGKISPDSWTVYYDRESWWDRPTVRHGDGTNFSFVDGHSEYWKWRDARTVKLAKEQINDPAQPGNRDLHAVQKAAWSKLGYAPTASTD